MMFTRRPKNENTNCEHKDRPHYARGMCGSCYRNTNHKKKYREDLEYRERTKSRMRKNYRKRCLKDPEYNARKQREFRRDHPDSFNRCMARFYLRRMTPEDRIKLMVEIS